MTEPRSSTLQHGNDPGSHPGEIDRLPERIAMEPRIGHGVIAGLIGAFVVAVVLLVRDVLAGQALWTPHTLGSALFLGETPAPPGSPAAPDPSAILVVGYTVVHGAVFVALGLLATFLVQLGSLGERPGLAAVVTLVALFVLFHVVFALFSAFFVDGDGLQTTWVSIANLLAAGGMAAYLSAARRSLARNV